MGSLTSYYLLLTNTKELYKQIDYRVNTLTKMEIKDYTQLNLCANYEKDRRIADFIYPLLFISLLTKLKAKAIWKTVPFVLVNVCLLSKLYYLYFVIKYKEILSSCNVD